MALSGSVQLPNNPSVGTVRGFALGGNGFSAPKFMYQLKNFSQTGDAGGGSNTLSVVMDPDYCSLIVYATAQVEPAGSLHDVKWKITGDRLPVMVATPRVKDISSAFPEQISNTWIPPPFVLPGGDDLSTLSVAVLNILAEVLSINCVVYLFDIRARETTPMHQLIASVGGMYNSAVTPLV